MNGHGCAGPERYQLLFRFADGKALQNIPMRRYGTSSPVPEFCPNMLELHVKYRNTLCIWNILADTPVVLLGPEQSMQEQDGVAHGLVGLRAIHLVG